MTRKRVGKSLTVGGTPTVNLLPPGEVERRSLRTLKFRWLSVSLAALLVVAVESAIGVSWTARAISDQDAAAGNSAQLQSQLAQYSEIIGIQAARRSLESFGAQAGSNDQDWAPLIAEIRAVLPAGVSLVGFRLIPGAAPTKGSDSATQVGLTGSLTFSASTTAAQPETIARLRTVKTFLDVDAGALSADDPSGGFTFVATFSADQTRYTGQFESAGGK